MNTKRALGFGVLAILAVLITLVAVHNIPGSLAALQQATSTRTPSPTLATTVTVSETTPQAITPEVTSDAVTTPEQIPLCTFDAQAQPALPALSLDSYTFSEPEVVLTGTTAIRLFQWLPDGQHLLIGRGIDGKPEELLEVVDLRTGESRQYTQAHLVGDEVAWLEAEQAVVFVESMPDNRNLLKLSYGIDEPIRELVADFRSPFSVKSDGKHLIFSANDHGGQLKVLQIPNRTTTPMITQLSGYYHTAPSPDDLRMAVYNRQHFYLVNQASEQICELDLGQVGEGEYSKVRASDVAWSADGRYLAMLTNYGNPVQFLALKIIDVSTKQFYDFEFNKRFVHGINWLPNSNFLLTTVDADPDPSKGNFDSLYLVNAITGDFKHILPEYQFFAAHYFGTLLSPDSYSIGIPCAEVVLPDTVVEWRICIIGMEKAR